MPKPIRKTNAVAVRDPGRTRERILSAALEEFAARGFAGARVGTIARRAAINKRMLYHYFGDKEALFREVLRSKMSERRASAEHLPEDPAETLPFWFQASCRDREWIRLLAWEALQGSDNKIIDERLRAEQVEHRLKRLGQRQREGLLAADWDTRHVLLALVSLTTFPVAFPQITRLIMGRAVDDPTFQAERVAFLQSFGRSLRPPQEITTVRKTKKK